MSSLAFPISRIAGLPPLSRVFALTGALTCLGIAAGPAIAQSSRYKTPSVQTRAPQASNRGALVAVISIARQRITIYDGHEVIATAPVSTGRSGYDTPQGVFSIIEKKEEHFSNLYDDAPMPFMQRITWSGVALHAGSLPGYPASHGCIRLPHSFAERLFGLTRMNMRVVIVPYDAEPTAISHPVLFQPRLAGAPAIQPRDIAPAPVKPDAPQPPRPPVDIGVSPMMLGAGLPKIPLPEVATVRPPAIPAVTSVVEAARLQRQAASLRAAAALKAVTDAKGRIKGVQIAARSAQIAAGRADILARRSVQRAIYAGHLVTRARNDDARAKADAAHVKAIQDAAAATTAAEAARASAQAKLIEAKAAVDAIKGLEAERVQAAKAALAAARLTEPVSVFVSARTGRLYVRQGRAPVFDVPVAIKDPRRPIGTHVFTATEATSKGDGVRWSVINVAAPGQAAPQPSGRRERNKVIPPPAPAQALGLAALERLEIPAEALDRITPYVQVGTSLIISDLGPSIETGQGTDFVVQTRGEAEAAASIARYVAEQRRNGTRRN